MPKKVLKRYPAWRSASPSLNSLVPPSPGTTPVPTPRPSVEPFTLAEGYTAMVEQYLAGNLPPLVPADNHTPSNSTREQSYFDMHLHKDLRLKKIKFLDRLPQVLSKVLDKYLTEPAITRQKDLRNIPKLSRSHNFKILNEETLTDCYMDLIKNHILLASQLYCGADVTEPIFLLSKNDPNAQRANAIADCYLYFGPPGALHDLAEAHKDDMNLIRKHRLENLVIWEFKSLIAGPDILDTLKTLEGDFDWLVCQESLTKDNEFTYCGRGSHRTNGRRKVTGRRTGPDSEIADNIIKQCLDSLRTIPEEEEEEEEEEEDETLNGNKSHPKKRQKIAYEEGNEQIVAHVGKLLQQMWTQIASEDATFAIISCGTKEYLCIRCRQTQTLYLSPLLEPIKLSHDGSSVPHAKLLISLFLCSYEDALSRAKQLEDYVNGNLCNISLPLMELKFDEDNRITRAQKKVVEGNNTSDMRDKHVEKHEIRVSKGNKREVENKRVLNALRGTNTVSLRPYVKDFAPNAPDPHNMTLARGGSGNPDSTQDPTIVVTVEIESSITDRVYKAYLFISDKNSQDLWYQNHIYIKIATNKKDLVKLTKEYEQYKRLNAEDASEVVEMFGFFECKEVEIDGASWYFLLLADGGQTLGDRTGSHKKTHLRQYKEFYFQALHSFNSRNIFHHDITSKHLVYELQGKKLLVRFISLSQCDEEPSHGEPDIEVLERHLAIKRVTI